MLIFVVKKEWYEKIRSGKKITEYRVVKRYWTIRLKNILKNKFEVERGGEEQFSRFNAGEKVKNLNIPCLIRLGYTNEYLKAKIDSIEIINGSQTDLHTNQLVYAIKLKDICTNSIVSEK